MPTILVPLLAPDGNDQTTAWSPRKRWFSNGIPLKSPDHSGLGMNWNSKLARCLVGTRLKLCYTRSGVLFPSDH